MPLVHHNKFHNTSNGNNNNSYHRSSPGIVLPRSQQQQLQQQQQDGNFHHGHHHNNKYSSTSTRGAREIGMLVMLLTAEAALLASNANSNHHPHQQQQQQHTKSAALLNAKSRNTAKNNNEDRPHHPVYSESSGSSSSAASHKDSTSSSVSDSGDVTPKEIAEMLHQNQDQLIQVVEKTGDINAKTTSNQKLLTKASGSTSSLPSASEEEDEDEIIEVNGVSYHFLNSSSRIEHGASLLNRIFEYLPWRDALIARETSKAWHLACTSVNCLFFKLPRSSCPAIFIYSQVLFDARAEEKIEPRLQHKSNLGRWKCDACGFLNSDTRILCGSRSCQMPIPTHRNAARLFAGQLRREGSVPYLRWLFEDIIGSDKHNVRIRNVENHRDASTQRGKGCCWVYLEDLEMATPAVDMHHRIFSDVGPDGREGAWIVPIDCRKELQEEIDYVSYTLDRPRVLPRGALVVERPVMTPQMAPENATISAKVVASHSSIAPTTNSYALMKSKQEQQQQHHQSPQYHHHAVHQQPPPQHLATTTTTTAIPDHYQTLVQTSPVKLSAKQGKRYAHNPYAFIAQDQTNSNNNTTVAPYDSYNNYNNNNSYYNNYATY